jgi:hypothetical protein
MFILKKINKLKKTRELRPEEKTPTLNGGEIVVTRLPPTKMGGHAVTPTCILELVTYFFFFFNSTSFLLFGKVFDLKIIL